MRARFVAGVAAGLVLTMIGAPAALAIGYAKERPLSAAIVKEFTATAIASGFVTRAIDKAGVRGAVAPGKVF